MKRENSSFAIELGNLYSYIVFYKYEINLNTSVQDTDI